MQGNKIISFNEKPKYIPNETNYFFSGLVLIPFQLKYKVFYELSRKKKLLTFLMIYYHQKSLKLMF